MHIVLSAPGLYGFMAGQVERLREMGYAPRLIAASSEWLEGRAGADGVPLDPLDIRRDISPLADALAFLRLVLVFRRERPSAVLLSGPKAIFLGGLAAWLADVPVRVAVYHGMRQERMSGPKRILLDACDIASFASATAVLAVSPSLSSLVKERGLDPWDKVAAIHPGTANGVEVARLGPPETWTARRAAARRRLRIPERAPVALCLGRVTEDKGLLDLEPVLAAAGPAAPDLHLLLVGPLEIATPAGRDAFARLSAHAQVRVVGETSDVSGHVAAADVLLFPSHREGFGMVVVEAGHMGLPAVGYDTTGVRDAIVSGVTGQLVPLGRRDQLAAALLEYVRDPGLRAAHGAAAHRHAARFDHRRIWESYRAALASG